MKTRNFMSIDYQNGIHKFSPNRFSLKNTYQDFYPQKTYSKGMHHTHQKFKLKSTLSNTFSPLNKDKPKDKTISTPSQTNPLSNRNTCYKTNGFSPYSTKSVFTQIKTIKEKNIRKKIPKNKKALLSMKYIEFIKDNKYNNIHNYNYLKLTKKDNNQKNDIINGNDKYINKEKIQYIFVGAENLPKNNNKKKTDNKTDDLINKNESNINKIQKNINSFSCPNIKLNTQKDKQNKNKKIKNLRKKFEVHNLFFEYSDRENEQILNNINNIGSHTISTFGNIKKNKGILVRLKNKYLKERKNTNFEINNDNNINNNKLNKNKSFKDFFNNKEYDLHTNIEMFDPLTFIKNTSLYKDYLQRKQREKILLKKLIKNNKLEELITNLNIYNNNDSNKLNNISNNKDSRKEDNKGNNKEKKKDKNKGVNKEKKQEKSLKHKINENKNNLTTNSQKNKIKHKKRNNIMKDLFLNPIKSPNNTNNNGKNSHKTYLKPSDYINEIAKKILENIGIFRNKKYEDKSNKKKENLNIYTEEKEENEENEEIEENEENDESFINTSNKKSLFDITLKKKEINKNTNTNINKNKNKIYIKTDKNKDSQFDIKNNDIKDKLENEKNIKIKDDKNNIENYNELKEKNKNNTNVNIQEDNKIKKNEQKLNIKINENRPILNGRNEENSISKKYSYDKLKIKFNNENKNNELNDNILNKKRSSNINIKKKPKIEDYFNNIDNNKNKYTFNTNKQNSKKNIQLNNDKNEENKKIIEKNLYNSNLIKKPKNKNKDFKQIRNLKNIYDKKKDEKNEKDKNKKKINLI